MYAEIVIFLPAKISVVWGSSISVFNNECLNIKTLSLIVIEFDNYVSKYIQSKASVAKWIRHLPSKQGIAGWSPAGGFLPTVRCRNFCMCAEWYYGAFRTVYHVSSNVYRNVCRQCTIGILQINLTQD